MTKLLHSSTSNLIIATTLANNIDFKDQSQNFFIYIVYIVKAPLIVINKAVFI